MLSWRTLVLVVVLSVVVAACSDAASTTSDGAVATPTTAASTTVAPTTTPMTVAPTTVAPTTLAPTTTLSAEPPIPDTSGDDWEQILGGINTFFEWLFLHPPSDTSLLDEIFVPGSPVDLGFRPFLEEQIANGWRDLPHPGLEIRSASLESMQDDGATALVLAVTDFDGSVTVDGDGAIVSETPDRPPNIVLYTLKLGDDGRWRLYELKVVGPAAGEAD